MTYTVVIIFTDEEIRTREYDTVEKAEKCVRIYSNYSGCKHVYIIEEK